MYSASGPKAMNNNHNRSSVPAAKLTAPFALATFVGGPCFEKASGALVLQVSVHLKPTLLWRLDFELPWDPIFGIC